VTVSKSALYQKLLADAVTVQCLLCPHRCIIADGKTGRCQVRRNVQGDLQATTWGQVAAMQVDPVEKKPLYHVFPAQKILSLGSWGCNLTCFFCQNWHISQQSVPTQQILPEEVPAMIEESGGFGVAWTYNEPIIWFEYLLETAKLVKNAGYHNVLVSNGFIEEAPLLELLPHVSAINFDLKAYTNSFYKDHCGGGLAPVLRSISLAHEADVIVEVTNLLIPSLNDNSSEIRELVNFIASLSPFIPLHFSRYHPDYQCTLQATPPDALLHAWKMAKSQLHHVYVGNLQSREHNSTFCHNCSAILLERQGFLTGDHLQKGKCPDCDHSLYGLFFDES
jgi:pyruvate formate lyase activating enzyme